MDIGTGLLGACAAVVTVVAGSAMAPAYRRVVALAVFVCGTSAAWVLLGSWYFPENHPLAYEGSARPLLLTLLGGVAGVGLVWARTRTTD